MRSFWSFAGRLCGSTAAGDQGNGKVDAGKAADKCIYGWWDTHNIITGAASYCDKDDAGVFSDGHVCRVYSGSGKTG